MFKHTLLGLAIGVALAGNAYAKPFTVDTGYDFGFGESSPSAALESMGFVTTLATSIYLGNPQVNGTQIIDTNKPSVINAYAGGGTGPNTAPYDTIVDTFVGNHNTIAAGNPLLTARGAPPPAGFPFRYPNAPGDTNIDSLNCLGGGSCNTAGFNNGIGFPGWGFGAPDGTWGLTYEYTIYGSIVGGAPVFTSGQFDIYFQSPGNANDGVEVLQVKVDGSNISGVSLQLAGHIDYSFCEPGCTSFQKSFFNFFGPPSSKFYDGWAGGAGFVTFNLDTDVRPPLPDADQLVAFGIDGDGTNGCAAGTFCPTAYVRQGDLTGTVVFNTPEPTMLALLGLGLLGMGFSRKRGLPKA